MSQEENKPDVLPPWGNQVMILLWLLLFGVRWLVIMPMEWTGVLDPKQMQFLDDVLLLPIYLVLLVVTCVVIGLRAARSAQTAPPSGRSETRSGAKPAE